MVKLTSINKMNVLIINGSPRKNWNTHQLLEKANTGAIDAGAEAEIVHLYDYTYKGCISCFACKRKGSQTSGLCAYEDGITSILVKAQSADVLIFGSPVYLHGMTGQMRAFLERLLFPITTYSVDTITGERVRFLNKIVPTGLIYTMNNPSDVMAAKRYDTLLGINGILLKTAYGHNEILYVNDTLQFKDYSKYEANLFDAEKKQAVHAEQFPIDCEKAYVLGKKLVTLAKASEL